MMTLYIRRNQPESRMAREALARAGVNCPVRDVLRSRKDIVPTPMLVDGNVECVGLTNIVGHILRSRTLDKTHSACYTGA